MTIEKVQCAGCDSTEIFLRKKGTANGLYCAGCGKWYKWVGKKDIAEYAHKGYKVHPQNYIPPTHETDAGEQTEEVASSPNSYLARYAKREDPSEHSNDVLDSIMPSVNRLRNDNEAAVRRQHEGIRTAPVVDSELVTDLDGFAKHFGTPKGDSFDICHVCATGVVEPVREDDPIVLSIFEGVAFVRTKDNGELYGSFNIAYCPSCGKKL